MNNGIFLLLGTNLGNRLKNLDTAKQLISKEIGGIERISSVYKTAPWGKTDQPDFYNQVIEIKSEHAPSVLLSKILQIENTMGRMRKEKWGPRVIDIDILFFNKIILNTPGLTLPHPALHERKFALMPMAEVGPEFYHPVFGKSISALLQECADNLPVERLA